MPAPTMTIFGFFACASAFASLVREMNAAPAVAPAPCRNSRRSSESRGPFLSHLRDVDPSPGGFGVFASEPLKRYH